MVFHHNNRKVSNTGGMLTTMQVYNDIDLLSRETLCWCMCRKMLVYSGDRVAIVSTMFNHRGQLDHLIYPVSNLLKEDLWVAHGHPSLQHREGRKVESVPTTLSAKPRSCYHSGAEE